MSGRWVTASHVAEWGLIRAHNGVGWLWTTPESFAMFAEDTRLAIERGEVPPPPLDDADFAVVPGDSATREER